MDNLQHNKINAEEYRKLIINAAQALEDNKEEINELNVFPVPDGDTGSNMSMTIGHAAEALLSNKDMTIEQVAVKTAKAMLHGARGNSGVIISLLFRGIAKGLENSTDCDGIAWARALQYGVEAAYKSVDRPAEGTILTVARCCAEAAVKAAQEENSFEYVLSAAIKEAEKALANTVFQNPVLEKAGVVDAGGKGWLLVMQAMLHALNKDNIDYAPKAEAPVARERADFSSFETEDITFGFCTEFIVRKHDGDADSAPLKAFLNTMGDSIVLVDDGEIIKVHVHTNDPHRVLGEALKYGVYETVKVENMRTQHTNKLVEEAEAPKKELKKYGFVSVSNGDGINTMFTELGVDAIVSGGQTMNPSTEDLSRAVESVDAENIFILPNNKNIIMTANQVADLTDKNIIVIPTKTIPQGFTAMLGFDMDAEPDANKEAMTENMSGVDTMQITYAARNSNFDGMDIKEGDYLALYNGKLLCSDSNIDVLFHALGEKISESGKSFVSIYYGEGVSESDAEKAVSIFEADLADADAEIALYNGAQPVYYYIISAE